MDYAKFKESIGKFSIPTPELVHRLVEGQDSIHAIFFLGEVIDDKYKITISNDNMVRFLNILEILDKRGAIRDLDYFIGGNKYPDRLTLEIHTTNNFLCEEDFL